MTVRNIFGLFPVLSLFSNYRVVRRYPTTGPRIPSYILEVSQVTPPDPSLVLPLPHSPEGYYNNKRYEIGLFV